MYSPFSPFHIFTNTSSYQKQMTSLSVGPSSSPLFGKKVGAKPERPPIIQPSPLTRSPSLFSSKSPKMVKLTEVEDEHFTDKPAAPKHDALLVSDDEDYSDTG
jgi:hypothetical protein